MSRSELERLARIRMQVTGESLERAMAVLQGHPTDSGPEPEPEPGREQELGQGPGLGRGLEPESASEPDENGAVDDTGTSSEGSEADATPAEPDARPTPQRRSHLRGL
ncbi:hypothetical protein [Streptomyces inhibens]|uniref:hypothetical protein n=1 Tax=Streptomyces inhibens TaxID=2293571 RepID=UPI001EE71533|nr:hypothetical protein [Streptomyces inhibens]UKY47727.1 hypothetical protein KI385_02010 [Streptomyces inhibens]